LLVETPVELLVAVVVEELELVPFATAGGIQSAEFGKPVQSSIASNTLGQHTTPSLVVVRFGLPVKIPVTIK